MDASARQALVDSYPDWYHAFDFGEGVVSRPRNPYPEIWHATREFVAGVDFAGREVLEIGCWDGYWSFAAERRGARRVLATDAVHQRWGSTRGFEIAHQLLQSSIEYRSDLSIYDIARLGRRFDIVICFGVYYHLTHLNTAFTALRHVLASDGLLLLEGSAIDDQKRAYLEFLYGSGKEPERIDPSNWVVPTRRCLRDMLSSNYFEVVRETFPFAGLRGRVLLEARAVERADPAHPYRPAFGLDHYDPRWSAGAGPGQVSRVVTGA